MMEKEEVGGDCGVLVEREMEEKWCWVSGGDGLGTPVKGPAKRGTIGCSWKEEEEEKVDDES